MCHPLGMPNPGERLGFNLVHKKCSPQNCKRGGGSGWVKSWVGGSKVGWVGLVQNTPPSYKRSLLRTPPPPVMTASRALIGPSGEDAMGRSYILDPPPGAGGCPAAVRVPAVVRMPACRSRRFKGDTRNGWSSGWTPEVQARDRRIDSWNVPNPGGANTAWAEPMYRPQGRGSSGDRASLHSHALGLQTP